MSIPHTPISPLRQRFIDDMSMRKLAPKTQSSYIRAVKRFAQFLGRSPYTATPEDLRRFQLQMVNDGVSAITLNATLTALRFLFNVTLDRAEALRLISLVRVPRKLPVVLNQDEVTRLLNGASSPNPHSHYTTASRSSEPRGFVQVVFCNICPLIPKNL